MAPENPARYTLDEDDRLQIPRKALPSWLQQPTEDGELFCVPIQWRRKASLPSGHELEAWCIWGEKATGTWLIDPRVILEVQNKNAVNFALSTLMYPAKYNSKGRLSCAGVFNEMAERSSSKQLWIAPEADSISIWTDAAFQWSFSRLGLV